MHRTTVVNLMWFDASGDCALKSPASTPGGSVSADSEKPPFAGCRPR